MIRSLRRSWRTLQLVLYALLPPRGAESASEAGDGEVRSCAPREFGEGMDRFLDGRGVFRVVFPECLALAAPAVLFRLKREGFSGCIVRCTAGGLYVEGRR